MPHLPADTPTLQLIAYIALTLASVTVAATSGFMAYRQNFGWKPVIFIMRVGGSGGAGGYSASLQFEFWNRQKYPVDITRITIEYSRTQIARGGKPPLTDRWKIDGENRIINRDHVTVKPAENAFFQTVAPINESSIPDLSENVTISVFYFDPIKNRIKKAAVDTEHTINLKEMSKSERLKQRLQFWK
jgi:hypothetical protein